MALRGASALSKADHNYITAPRGRRVELSPRRVLLRELPGPLTGSSVALSWEGDGRALTGSGEGGMIAAVRTMVAAVSFQNTPLGLIAEKQREIEALGWREYDRADPWLVRYEKDFAEEHHRGADAELRRVMGDYWLSPDETPSLHGETSAHKRSAMSGEIDPTGGRKDALDAFLQAKLREGFEIETNTDTHAIVVERDEAKSFLGRFRVSAAAKRYVVSVDEHGEVTMIPAEPKRS
jgi:hypothetical protein